MRHRRKDQAICDDPAIETTLDEEPERRAPSEPPDVVDFDVHSRRVSGKAQRDLLAVRRRFDCFTKRRADRRDASSDREIPGSARSIRYGNGWSSCDGAGVSAGWSHRAWRGPSQGMAAASADTARMARCDSSASSAGDSVSMHGARPNTASRVPAYRSTSQPSR